MEEKKELKEEVKEIAAEIKEEAEEAAAEIKEEAEEAAAEVKEEAEETAAEIKEEAEEAAEEIRDEVKETADKPAMSVSTENKRKKKAERRDAKAARKAANKVEEKKSRPNNVLLAILIFGVLIGMFAFVGGYNYFSKPASIEKYMEDNGGDDLYGNFMVDTYTTAKLKADGNTLKIFMTVADDAPEDVVENYKSDDGTDDVKYIAAYFLTQFKPETRGFTGTVKAVVKQGDERLNYVKMSYREAKKYLKEEEKKAQEEAEQEEAEEEESEDAADDASAEEEDGAETE